MSRTVLALSVLVLGLMAFIAVLMFNPANSMFASTNNGLNEDSVRTIVSQMLAEQNAQLAEQDEAALKELTQNEVAIAAPVLSSDLLNPMIEEYLMGNPKILQRVSNALQEQLRVEELETAKLSLASYQTEIYEEAGDVVLGNPDGDVTLVEFFDYNCAFCRRAMPDMAKLLEEDTNLRIILKEFPILSENSVDAARVAVAVASTPDSDYWAFHELLFTARGQISGETALAAAKQIGMNPISLELDMQSDAVTSILQRNYALAQNLNITGTPAYIIGDEIIPGAVGVDALRTSIANMRECGSTICPTQ